MNRTGESMFIELAKTRRSVRTFAQRPVEKEKIDTIIEAALRGPTARSKKIWEFVVVTDKDLLEKLAAAKPSGAGFIKDAAVAIVVCGDPAARLWIEDCSIAAVTMQYAACDLGLASCWASMRLNDYSDTQTSAQYLAGLLGLPAELMVECIIAIGYPGVETLPHRREDLHFEKFSHNRFGRKWG